MIESYYKSALFCGGGYLPNERWTSVRFVSQDDIDESVTDYDYGCILDESAGGSELEMHPVPVEP